MDWIDKYKRVEEDQLQGKEMEKIIPQRRSDFRSDQYNNNRLRRDFAGQSEPTNTQMVNAVFREPVQQVLEKIKNESFFKWLNKMTGDSTKHNRSLYCQYHQDHRHNTEDCRNLWNHLDHLIREGKLRHLLHPSSGYQGQLPAYDFTPEPKRPKVYRHPILGFSEEDKFGTIQPHDNALVITLRIGGYNVKRVIVDGGNRAEIMYPNLYKRLKLRPKDLTSYGSPLLTFDGKMVMPNGQIRLPVQIGPKIVEANFIVMDTYSPYTAIVARPWLHTLGAVASTLHQKVKFPSEGRVLEIQGCQAMARECLVAAISHRPEAESSARVEESS
ncbi:uncharacterized protein LOC115990940 [Quercus lobata]|uniref:uncharacterized protein LOC115990940 n=1 Tax=Quercus lobata TaxID=97700 RepID=UPI00124906BD|nr:uncharacterized protein LOC115990940 [Quercus lobata]